MKAFISYSTNDKKHGAYIKGLLDTIGVDSFLAHDDLHVSDEWKKKILLELKSCNVFIPILSKSFKSSDWCGQETGLASNRKELLIIPLSIDGTNPYGFISHIQAHDWHSDELERQVLITALGKKWPEEVVQILLPLTENICSFRQAEAAIEPLVPYFPYFTKEQANIFSVRAVRNGQIWSAHKCRSEFLPEFIKVNADNLEEQVLKELKYQVENDERYIEKLV